MSAAGADKAPREVPVAGAIDLGAFLKISGAAVTGGEAKNAVQAGEVRVNGIVETRRGRKLRPGDLVEVGGSAFRVGRKPALSG